MATKIDVNGNLWKQGRKGWVNQVTGAVVQSSKEIPAKRKQMREYRQADSTLLSAYLTGKDIDTLPADVLALYGAAVALTKDWSSKDIGKVEQLLWLSKTLPDYTPASIKKYCSCSGTESRRLSKALRSVAAVIAPYAAADMVWAYELNFIRTVNAGAEYPYSDGIVGGKETRLGLAIDIAEGSLGGLNCSVAYPNNHCEGLDTTPIVRTKYGIKRYSKWMTSDEYEDSDYSSKSWEEIELELVRLQAEAVGKDTEVC